MKQLAQIDLYVGDGYKGLGDSPLANPGNGIDTFTKFVSTIIGVMTIVAFIWFVFVLFTGAIGIVSSGGDKGALEASRKKITTGIIGVVVVVSSIFMAQLIGYILGIPNLLTLTELFIKIQQP